MFNEWLLKKLQEMDWKQADLARRSGITTGSISNYINGRIPDKKALIKIAKAFKMPAETIFQLAGVLPEESKPDELTKEGIYILQRLNLEEKEDAIRYLRLRLKIQEERKKKNKT